MFICSKGLRYIAISLKYILSHYYYTCTYDVHCTIDLCNVRVRDLNLLSI